MKKRIILAIVIIILLSSLSLINYLTSNNKKIDPMQEVSKCIENNNSSYIIKNGEVECNLTTTAETTTGATTTTTTKKKTTKKTTKKITMQVNAQQQEMINYLMQEVLNMGWTTKDYEAAVNIVIKESSWNPNSINKTSGACGLFQAYPCKKAVQQYPDYMKNYKSQIKWGLNYIKGRYKTPSKAWEFWQQHKWY